MEPLALTRLRPLMERTAGRSQVVVGLIDGPVRGSTASLGHGTFVAAMLAAPRGSGALAICPECTFRSRPIFVDGDGPWATPSATPGELAAAIAEVIEEGANVVNLSCQLSANVSRAEAASDEALDRTLDYAAARGAICVSAAGNEGLVASSRITRHNWVVPVAACDHDGRPTDMSNLGYAIGRRGLLAPGQGQGTSVAAPFVTGTVALLWSEFPEARAVDIRRAVTQQDTARRASVVPPLLDAWGAYLSLSAQFGDPRA